MNPPDAVIDTDETPLESVKTKRKKTANVPAVGFIYDTVFALPPQQYSPADRDKLRSIARQVMHLENIVFE